MRAERRLLMIYFDAPYGTVSWDDATQCVHVEWKGFVHGEMIKTVLNKALDLFRTKTTDRWLADMRKVKVFSEEDSRWVNETWFPAAVQAGVRRMALPVPESVLAQLSLQRLMRKVNGGELVTAYFGSVEEAKAWLVNGD
jgi:hypothetical protein